ncbi:MAG: endonuclease domain-containing protein [Candidatus Kapabacteria bacterium]|nr:endonuclease domain-containing protein [Candidatus Kapabacteria bacterium]
MFAKENRQGQTYAEKIFWNMVRNNRLGYKFRRQQILVDYIVDFFCLELKLIVEIDGDYHLNKVDYDETRTLFFEELGYKVIRFTNEEIIGNGNLVYTKLLQIISEIK